VAKVPAMGLDAGRTKKAVEIARTAPIKIRNDLNDLILLTVFISPSS